MGWLDNPWGHWFSVYAKYSEKLTFLTLIRAGVRNTTFSKNIVYILNGLFPSASSLNYVNILCASGKQWVLLQQVRLFSTLERVSWCIHKNSAEIQVFNLIFKVSMWCGGTHLPFLISLSFCFITISLEVV